jgi:hypothetical protein
MIADGIHCKVPLAQLVRENPKDLKEWSLVQADWTFLAQLYTALHPFYDFTKLASDDGVTIGTVQSAYFELASHIKRIINREGDFCSYDIRIIDAFRCQKVQDKFAKYKAYMDDCPIYLITSILDPRLKGSLLSDEYPGEPDKLSQVRTIIHKLYPAQRPNTPASAGPTPSGLTPSNFQAQLLRRVHKDTTPVSDVDRYLDGPIVAWDGNEDPEWVLKWWKANAALYPTMSQVARDYLSIPPAEVDVERLFSEGRDLLGLRRHSMSPETMKAVMFSRYEYRRQNN